MGEAIRDYETRVKSAISSSGVSGDMEYKVRNMGKMLCDLDNDIADLYREIGQPAKAVRSICRF